MSAIHKAIEEVAKETHLILIDDYSSEEETRREVYDEARYHLDLMNWDEDMTNDVCVDIARFICDNFSWHPRPSMIKQFVLAKLIEWFD